MSKPRRLWLLAALPLTACVDAGDAGPPPAGVTSALGQPSGDFPSYDERLVLYVTNRARTDPSAEGWPAYAAQPPLQWNVDLNHSARAHSIDMRDTPCFQHPSCDGTDPFVRIGSFYTGPMRSAGENIAAGVPDAVTVVHNWLFEIGAAAGETGHRDNIFSSAFTLMGAGFAAGGMPRMLNDFWTQDFIGTTVTRPRLTDGIHFAVAAGSVTFGTTYYDAGGAAPARIAVVVDGACTTLALARGTAARGAYEASLPLADGCHAYYFLATTGTTDATYPDSGALQVGVGAAASSCALFTTARPAGTCSGAGGAPGGGGGAPAGGSGGGGGGGIGAATGGAGPGSGETSGISGGCSCDVPGGGPSGFWLAGLFAAVLLARRAVARR